MHVLEAVIISIKKHWFDVSSSMDTFLQDIFQMSAISLVSVINYYHINGFHLFWDTVFFFFFLYSVVHCNSKIHQITSSFSLLINTKSNIISLFPSFSPLLGLVWFYGTSIIVGYLMPNSFLYIWIVLFQKILFSISIVFCLHSVKCQNSSISSLAYKNSSIYDNSV